MPPQQQPFVIPGRTAVTEIKKNVVQEPVRPDTSTVTSVAGSATSVQLLASNGNRRGAFFYNDSNANLFLKLGTTASATDFTVRVGKNDFYELPEPNYTGRIDGIWSSANGDVRITELT